MDGPAQAVSQPSFRPAQSPFAGLFGVESGEPPARSVDFLSAGAAALDEPFRACDGCPPRRPVRAIIAGPLGVNVVFNLVNLLTREDNDEFKVTPASWWENLKYGFEWDYNSFEVNQFGHPYQGSLYFNAGRANGLSFWESAPLAALGSLTWEYFGEKNHASVNDFVTTTMGGIALGEMFYRTGWLVRDTRLTGRSRFMKELLATFVDPVTGLSRFVSGDASRVSDNPPDLKPDSTSGDFEAGVQWNGEPNERAINSTGKPFLGMRLNYNDIFTSPFKMPYDAFGLSVRFGGGSSISEASIRGRLYGRFLGGEQERNTEFLVAQAYDYQSNGVFEYGGQSVVAGFSHLFEPSDSVSVAVFGVGGPVLLGAIRSGLITETAPSEAEGEGEEEVVQRKYDYGPGVELGAGAALRVRGFPVARLTYAGFYIHTVSSVEGVNGRHYAQFLRLDILAPLWRQLRLGVSGDYVNRATYYDTLPDVHQWLPQLRVFLAKVSR